MTRDDDMPTPDEFLFGNGLELDDYFIARTPVADLVCANGGDGRDYRLLIGNDQLREAVLARLLELGVRIVERSTEGSARRH